MKKCSRTRLNIRLGSDVLSRKSKFGAPKYAPAMRGEHAMKETGGGRSLQRTLLRPVFPVKQGKYREFYRFWALCNENRLDKEGCSEGY